MVNNERICDTFDCPDVAKQAASETQVISFSDDVPNIEIECNSCISNLHKRVSHSSMIHISSYVNMTKECSHIIDIFYLTNWFNLFGINTSN